MRRLPLLFSLVLFAALPVRAQDDLPEVRPLVFEETVEVPGATADELHYRRYQWWKAFEQVATCCFRIDRENLNCYIFEDAPLLLHYFPTPASVEYSLHIYVNNGYYTFRMDQLTFTKEGLDAFRVDPILDGLDPRLNRHKQGSIDWITDFFAAYYSEVSASLRKVMTAEPDIVLE